MVRTRRRVLVPGEQRVIPNFIQWLRDQSYAAVPPRGTDLAKALFVAVAGDGNGVFVGGRTSAPGGGGHFGVAYTAMPMAKLAGFPSVAAGYTDCSRMLQTEAILPL